MPFYDEIADYYDAIFPLNKAQIGFVQGSVALPHLRKRILDVGCGTGDLALSLAEAGFEVTGIDSDMEMLRRADWKVRPGRVATFSRVDMREVAAKFGPSSFDGVLCFGNTLVHLDGPDEIEGFFGQVKIMLKGTGPFLFQILNYDHILDHGVRELPLIETDEIRFDRFYEYLPEKERIAFRTALFAKKEGQRIENEILLYPIRREPLVAALKKQGFTEISLYGDFARGPLKTDSLPLVGEAR